ASAITASFLSISGQRPKSPVMLLRVWNVRFSLPSKSPSTKTSVPLPPRFGPTIKKIFCCRVSGVRQYPKISCSVFVRLHVPIPLLVCGPKTFEEFFPAFWLRRIRVVVERHTVGREEQRIVGPQLPVLQIQQSIATGNEIVARFILRLIQPKWRLPVLRNQNGVVQRVNDVVDLVFVGVVGSHIAVFVLRESDIQERVEVSDQSLFGL